MSLSPEMHGMYLDVFYGGMRLRELGKPDAGDFRRSEAKLMTANSAHLDAVLLERVLPHALVLSL